MKTTGITAICVSLTLGGCGGGNSYLAAQNSTVEMYHIFDIKTAASTAVVAKAATDGLSQNTNGIQSAMPLQLDQGVPLTPGRFKLENMAAAFGGSGGALLKLASMQQGGGLAMKVANCDGAVWNAKAVRSISGSSNLTLYSCLYRYKAGFNLDMYAVFTKQEGGLYQISQTVANSIVGTPEQWVNKTIMDTVRSIERATTAKATHLEGQPELSDLPALDKITRQ